METTNEPTKTDAAPATDAPVQDAPAQEEQQDPSIIGRLTPEEHQALLRIRQQSQQLMAKIGEHEVLKSRLLGQLDELDGQGQGLINAVSKRLGLEDGQQWVGMQDGTVRLVNPPAPAQTQEEEGADASS
jgi:hypothetical protein